MKTNPDEFVHTFYHPEGVSAPEGLTKREYFVAMAMQGLCSWNHNEGKMLCDHTSIQKRAIEIADATINLLNMEKES